MRSTIRKTSFLHKNLRVSLQTLSGEETLQKLELLIDKREDPKLRGIQRVLEELLVSVDSEDKPCGWLEFGFAFDLFLFYFEREAIQREWFRDCLLNPEFGIPVLIYRARTGKQWIILNDGSASLQGIFLQLVGEEEEKCDQEEMDDVTTEMVRRDRLCMCVVEVSGIRF